MTLNVQNEAAAAGVARDSVFLQWIYDRLVFVYKENELYDYMMKLKSVIEDMEKVECDHRIGIKFDWDDGLFMHYASDTLPINRCWKGIDLFNFCPDCGVELPRINDGPKGVKT